MVKKISHSPLHKIDPRAHMRMPDMRAYRCASAIVLVAALTGCAALNPQASIDATNSEAQSFTQGQLALARSKEQREHMRQTAESLLAKPLSQNDAVQLALNNSPAMQALLAEHWAASSEAQQSGRLINPRFSFEATTLSSEREIARLLSFGLLDLITLPQRQSQAAARVAQARLQLMSDVIEHITQIRQAWVNAVAAEQSVKYALQVKEAAIASNTLAERMLKAGNFNKLDRARQQAFHADAYTQAVASQQAASRARETLVRLLGLDDAQAKRLSLPEQLPELPRQPREAQEVSAVSNEARLDLRLAKAELDAAAKQQGLGNLMSYVDIELGLRYDTIFDNGLAEKANRRGYEVSLQLPIFDWGGVKRDAMHARTLAAVNRLEAATRAAGSHLRSAYADYLAAYDIAKNYRDEVIPLSKTIAEESLLRYNGMIIGVFELLAESRAQVQNVIAAINAQQQFWLADAALQAAEVGKPIAASSTSLMSTSAASSSDAKGH